MVLPFKKEVSWRYYSNPDAKWEQYCVHTLVKLPFFAASSKAASPTEIIRKKISFCWAGGWLDNCWKSTRPITVNTATENGNAQTAFKRMGLCTMYSARRSTQSFVPEQNYTVCTFWLDDDGDVHGVHHDNEKTNLYLVQISWNTSTWRQSNKPPCCICIFCLKKALCKYQFTCQYKLKRMEECFYLLVGLPHQCLLLSQDPRESGHRESSFEDQLHAVTNKKEQKLM